MVFQFAQFFDQVADIDFFIRRIEGVHDPRQLPLKRFNVAGDVTAAVLVVFVFLGQGFKINAHISNDLQRVELFFRIHARKFQRVEGQVADDRVKHRLRTGRAETITVFHDQSGARLGKPARDHAFAQIKPDHGLVFALADRLALDRILARQRPPNRIKHGRFARTVLAGDLDEVLCRGDVHDLQLFDVFGG